MWVGNLFHGTESPRYRGLPRHAGQDYGGSRCTELADFEFTEAEEEADAITKFDLETTDMVFADWNMPAPFGLPFLRIHFASSDGKFWRKVVTTVPDQSHR